MRMKPWQWAVIVTEATLLFGVLGALAWLLLLNSQGAVVANPAPLSQLATQAQLPTATPILTETPTPVPLALVTPLPTRTPQPTNTRVISRVTLNQGTIDQIEQQVIWLRDITPRATLSTEFLARDQIVDNSSKSYASNRAEAEKLIALYRALGLIPSGAQVTAEALVKTTSSNIAGYYDPQSKHLYVVSDLENLNAEDKATVAHEYTHALQDQQFDLGKYQSRMLTTDMRLAMMALPEGDATLVMAMYLYGNVSPVEWQYMAYRAAFSAGPIITATDVSTRAIQISIFPYLQGEQFVFKLWQDGKGWAQVNHAYADPPLSTSLILHPERYLTGHATPVPVTLPDLGPTLGKDWKLAIKADTLGEFVTGIHLDEFLNDARRSAQAADGWEGDSFWLWQAPDGRRVFAWQIAWDTPRDVGEFSDAYSALLQKRVGSGLAVEREDATVHWYSSEAGSGLIIRRTGEQTLVLWGPDKATVEKMMAVFK